MYSPGRRFVVVTSIFSPTKTICEVAKQDGGRVIVVGDRKTPADWSCDGTEYLSPDAQLATGWRSAELYPWNRYGRKIVGYLEAIAQGSDAIVDLDDDNIPKADFGFPPFQGRFQEVRTDSYYNAYRRFTDELIWPRGYPLRQVTAAVDVEESTSECSVGVWQALADGDPDVDAIYRLTMRDIVKDPIYFREGDPVVLAPGTICPFNSQNTLFSKRAFPLLYLPATVTMRSSDIIRSLVAQPILWAADLRLGFLGANVTQERNEHDYLDDFEDEMPLYLRAEDFSKAASSAVKADRSIDENLRSVYRALADQGLVDADELTLLDAWLEDLAVVAAKELSNA
jgi:STELLO glycosyltransferases